MYRLSTLFILLYACVTFSTAQYVPQHKGPFLSASMGGTCVLMGNKISYTSYDKLNFTSLGLPVIFEFGHTIGKKLIIHGQIMMLPSKIITTKGDKNVLSFVNEQGTIHSIYFGAVIRYYFVPDNYYLSGSIGLLTNTINSPLTTSESKEGLAYQFKAGKEWWFSKYWAAGAGFSYNFSFINHQSFHNTEKISVNIFSLYVSLTRN